MAARRGTPSLAQLIRRSPLLDAGARRRWLDVLPHLTEDDQARLREILTGERADVGNQTDRAAPASPPHEARGEQEAGDDAG